jgi:hypothetical protein
MKKLHLLLFLISTPIVSFDFFSHFNLQDDSSKLSTEQTSLLKYLQNDLEKHDSQIKVAWTESEDVRIMLELLEFSVATATPETKNLMISKIIQIFKTFRINIFFSDDNTIHRTIINLEPNYDNDDTDSKNLRDKKRKHKKKQPHHIKSDKNSAQPALARIRGANRTRKKLERERQDRETTKESLKERLPTKRPIPQDFTNDDLRQEGIHQEAIRQRIKRLSQQARTAQKRNNEPEEHEPDSGVLQPDEIHMTNPHSSFNG